jgi:hypothetical protein
MSNDQTSKPDNQMPCMVITLDEYKFRLADVNEPDGFVEYKGKMEVSYDGEFLGIDAWEAPIDKEFDDGFGPQSLTLVSANQANLLVGAILALLETYGEDSFYYDEDIQKEYKQMVQATKDAYAEKTANECQP